MGSSDRLVSQYMSALDLGAVCIAERPAQPITRILPANNPDAARAKLEKSCGNLVAFDVAGVFFDRRDALAVVNECNDRLSALEIFFDRDGWVQIENKSAHELVRVTVEELRLVTSTTESIRAHAQDVVAHIERTLQEMRSTGGLKMFNRSYREYRLKAAAAGKGAMLYGGYIQNFKMRLVRSAAEIYRTTNRSDPKMPKVTFVTSAMSPNVTADEMMNFANELDKS